MNEKEMNKMINNLSQKLGVSEDELKNATKSGKIDKLLKNNNNINSEKLQSILNDPEKTKQILNSPQAQALIKLLSGNNE
jgi:hypothetical protein